MCVCACVCARACVCVCARVGVILVCVTDWGLYIKYILGRVLRE